MINHSFLNFSTFCLFWIHALHLRSVSLSAFMFPEQERIPIAFTKIYDCSNMILFQKVLDNKAAQSISSDLKKAIDLIQTEINDKEFLI